MPVPFETLIPYGIIIVVRSARAPARGRTSATDGLQMFGVSGAGLNKIKNMQSGGKRHRWSVDQWDKVGGRHGPASF
jgi:hypothetical protein